MFAVASLPSRVTKRLSSTGSLLAQKVDLMAGRAQFEKLSIELGFREATCASGKPARNIPSNRQPRTAAPDARDTNAAKPLTYRVAGTLQGTFRQTAQDRRRAAIMADNTVKIRSSLPPPPRGCGSSFYRQPQRSYNNIVMKAMRLRQIGAIETAPLEMADLPTPSRKRERSASASSAAPFAAPICMSSRGTFPSRNCPSCQATKSWAS